MDDLVLNPQTLQALQALLRQPPQAVVLIGEKGMGKKALAKLLGAELLLAKSIDGHPSVHHVGQAGDNISIDDIRALQHFLSRRSTSSASVNRLIFVPDAGRMGHEAQNAFLKTLEEPPAGSVLLLTANHEHELLSTIMSRLHAVTVHQPSGNEVSEYFARQGYAQADIQRSLLMSGGLPGLMSSLLSNRADHPLVAAAETARDILRLDTFARLSLVDALSKQRNHCLDICILLERMAEISLRDKAKTAAHEQWRSVLAAAYDTEQAIMSGAGPKLALTSLMCAL
jgi:hypothetical protein